MDNSLQDCSELPSGDVSESDIVQDYKKLSKKQSATNLKVKLLRYAKKCNLKFIAPSKIVLSFVI
jgi:hypothetical protein